VTDLARRVEGRQDPSPPPTGRENYGEKERRVKKGTEGGRERERERERKRRRGRTSEREGRRGATEEEGEAAGQASEARRETEGRGKRREAERHAAWTTVHARVSLSFRFAAFVRARARWMSYAR